MSPPNLDRADRPTRAHDERSERDPSHPPQGRGGGGRCVSRRHPDRGESRTGLSHTRDVRSGASHHRQRGNHRQQLAGYTGTGFVNTANAVGAGVELTLTIGAAGNGTLVFRYANGTTSDRPASITVNGTTQATLQFPPTGSWSTWSTQTATVSLVAGANVVRATATTAGGLANLDSLMVDAATLFEAEGGTIINGE